jgi:Arc/MetJ-type ribon-helix-helix transcriptional regulator
MTAPPPTGPLRAVHLPEEVVRGLEERMKDSAFENVDAFIAFVLGRLIDSPANGEAFSLEDERQLKERLRSLGYID